jgi:hypothetical protein
MMYKAKVAVCSEIRTKHSTQSEHHVEFFNVNLVVRRQTARLLKVKRLISLTFESCPSPFGIFCRLQLGHKAATHYSRHNNLALPNINKKK